MNLSASGKQVETSRPDRWPPALFPLRTSSERVTQPMKQLIVNADDLGISVSTNLAIERGFRRGILRSASLMTNMEASLHACRQVLQRNPTLGAGLHLCLTSGRPVLPAVEVPSLVGADGFFRHGFFGLVRLLRSASREDALTQIAAEWTAQADRMEEWGVAMDHIDSHQHVHNIPALFAIAAEIAHARGVAIRVSDERMFWSGHVGRRCWDAIRRGGLVKKLLLSHFSEKIRREGNLPACVDHYFGVVHSGRMILARLLEIVRRLPEGITEINVHPGAAVWSDSALDCSREDQKFLRRPERAAELDAVLSPIIREELRAHEIELTQFGQILSSQKRRLTA
jgi:predicted glycoside hydrolase/deacetylase ChbG (UPF0249 family)